jgi:hypothetical protein
MGEKGWMMRDRIDDIRKTIERCHRLAGATSDTQVAAGLRQMADDLKYSLDTKAVNPIAADDVRVHRGPTPQ